MNQAKTVRNIILFTVLVNGLAWLGPILGGDPTEPGLGFLVWGTAPIVAALVMKFGLRGRISLGMRPALKGNGRWYALSLLVYPITIVLVLALGLILGAATLDSVTGTEFVAAMLPLALIYFLFALFEEVGWRGYLAPEVSGLTDGILGHALVGLIWASWHFPYLTELWAHTSEPMITLLPRFILGTIVSAVVYGEIRMRTGSVWPAVLMHWAGNTLANSLLGGSAGVGFVSLVQGREWLSSFGVEGVLMMALFGLVGGGLYWQRRAKKYSPPPPSIGQAAQELHG